MSNLAVSLSPLVMTSQGEKEIDEKRPGHFITQFLKNPTPLNQICDRETNFFFLNARNVFSKGHYVVFSSYIQIFNI